MTAQAQLTWSWGQVGKGTWGPVITFSAPSVSLPTLQVCEEVSPVHDRSATEPPGKPGGEGGGLAIKKQGLVSDGLGTEAGPTWLPQPLRLLGREFSPNLLMTHGAGR